MTWLHAAFLVPTPAGKINSTLDKPSHLPFSSVCHKLMLKKQQQQQQKTTSAVARETKDIIWRQSKNASSISTSPFDRAGEYIIKNFAILILSEKTHVYDHLGDVVTVQAR